MVVHHPIHPPIRIKCILNVMWFFGQISWHESLIIFQCFSLTIPAILTILKGNLSSVFLCLIDRNCFEDDMFSFALIRMTRIKIKIKTRVKIKEPLSLWNECTPTSCQPIKNFLEAILAVKYQLKEISAVASVGEVGLFVSMSQCVSLWPDQSKNCVFLWARLIAGRAAPKKVSPKLITRK